MSAFEGERGGIIHRYEVSSQGLAYEAASTRVSFRWEELKRIEPGSGASLYLVPEPPRQKLGVWLPAPRIEAFLAEAIAAWGAKRWETALKAAFDYSSEERAMAWVWLVLTIFFPVLLSVLLLVDGFHTLKCNRLLVHARPATAEVVKAKKNRRGNVVWTLRFTSEGGAVVQGARTAYSGVMPPQGDGAGGTANPGAVMGTDAPIGEHGIPTGPVTVAYAPEDLSCWDLSARPGQAVVNAKQRHFDLLMTMSFGWVFALLGAFGLSASLVRLRRRNPFRECVKRAADLLAAGRSAI